ncbi:MAG: hypothetical protein IKI03_01875 [Clostridia bacterium]|nr:hypothetical protein [Clostridia bacterium]
MKKSICIFELASHSLLAVLLFVPGFANLLYWKYDSSFVYHGQRTLKVKETMSLLDGTMHVSRFGWVYIAFLVCAIVFACLLLFNKRIQKFPAVSLIIASAETIAYVVTLILLFSNVTDTEYFRIDTEAGSLVYIYSLILLVSVIFWVIGFITRNKRPVQEQPILNSMTSEK